MAPEIPSVEAGGRAEGEASRLGELPASCPRRREDSVGEEDSVERQPWA